MEFIGHFRRLTPVQRNTFIACFLGWSLDAFDFFILIFCVSALATQFQTKVSAITEAIFLTLAMRPVGAVLFGLMADKFGRRPTLMVDIIAYSVFELASAFAPSLKFFLIMRVFFGIAMGGEWGVGAVLSQHFLSRGKRSARSGPARADLPNPVHDLATTGQFARGGHILRQKRQHLRRDGFAVSLSACPQSFVDIFGNVFHVKSRHRDSWY